MKMDIKIKSVKSIKHIRDSMALVKRVFMEFEAPEYEPEGVNHFLDYIAADAIKERIEKAEITIWCAIVSGDIAGVIAMRPPCAISLLFVDKSYHRQGIAKYMVEYAVKHYRKADELVTVNSSPYAVEAYRKMGFTKTGPEETASGVRFLPMVYSK